MRTAKRVDEDDADALKSDSASRWISKVTLLLA